MPRDGDSVIGASARKIPKRKRAAEVATPNAELPVSSKSTDARKGVGSDRECHRIIDAHGIDAFSVAEIEASVRKHSTRKRAVVPLTPGPNASASAQNAGGDISDGEGQEVCDTHGFGALTEPLNEIDHSRGRRKSRAKPSAAPTKRPPETSEPLNRGEGQISPDTHFGGALTAVIKELVGVQRQRVFAITQKSRSDRAIESLIAQVIGFQIDADAKQRKEIFAQAKAFRLQVEKGDERVMGHNSLASYVPTILASAGTRETWDKLQDSAEKKMVELAKLLPVYEFVKSVKGFGLVGLAAICAEAGIPIGDYRTVSGLWKRMGLAVIGGERQQRKRGKEDAEAHGYSPKRRSQVWQFFSDSMFRHQWIADKDEDGKDPKKTGKEVAVPAHPGGQIGRAHV